MNDDNALAKPKKSRKTHRFSALEDQRLQELVGQFGPRDWRSIAQYMPGRTARQCRDRYMNYLSPEFYNEIWTKDDDILLYHKFVEYGSQWSKIVQFFPGKNANNIKNRWNYSVSRMEFAKDANPIPKLKETDNKPENPKPPKKLIAIPHEVCSFRQSFLGKKLFSNSNIEKPPRKLAKLPPISTLINCT